MTTRMVCKTDMLPRTSPTHVQAEASNQMLSRRHSRVAMYVHTWRRGQTSRRVNKCIKLPYKKRGGKRRKIKKKKRHHPISRFSPPTQANTPAAPQSAESQDYPSRRLAAASLNPPRQPVSASPTSHACLTTGPCRCRPSHP